MFVCIKSTHFVQIQILLQKIQIQYQTNSVRSDATDEDSLEMAPVLVNGSPKLPHLPMPSALDHESFDITLHRRENEGFGFVILTSKSKPPYGGENHVFICFKNPFLLVIQAES